ncbi:MAG: metal ABC transporter permease [Ignavibacteriales bacterium]|nr:metal ABC transporter permease [Ignavibacteriales bacterium]
MLGLRGHGQAHRRAGGGHLPRGPRRHRARPSSSPPRGWRRACPRSPGALAFAVLSAALIGLVSLKAKQREDTVINAIWAMGMSVGVLFIAKTPGYADPMSYLFGNILLISGRDLVLLAVLDRPGRGRGLALLPPDRGLRLRRGVRPDRGACAPTLVFLAILAVVAVSVVLLQTFVGIVMVIAMLTLPSGTAGFAARNLRGHDGAGVPALGPLLGGRSGPLLARPTCPRAPWSWSCREPCSWGLRAPDAGDPEYPGRNPAARGGK